LLNYIDEGSHLSCNGLQDPSKEEVRNMATKKKATKKATKKKATKKKATKKGSRK
jgi:hypothetical protein